MNIDDRVARRYQLVDENERLWLPGRGDLVRRRTWDIFDRYLPHGQQVADIGGGPGAHAAYLAAKGHTVTTIDPVGRHVEKVNTKPIGSILHQRHPHQSLRCVLVQSADNQRY